MALSRQSQHVCDVVEVMKDLIIDTVTSGGMVETEEVPDYLRRAMKKVAAKDGIKEATVRAAVSRSIGYDSREFYDAVKNMIEHPEQETLTHRMQSRVKGTDTDEEIESRMRTIFPF